MRIKLVAVLTTFAVLISFSAVTNAAVNENAEVIPCKNGEPCWKKEIRNGKTENSAEEKYFALTPGAAEFVFTGGDKAAALVTLKLLAPGKTAGKDPADYDHTYLIVDGEPIALSTKSPTVLLKSGSGWRVDMTSYAFSNQPPSASSLAVKIYGAGGVPKVDTFNGSLLP